MGRDSRRGRKTPLEYVFESEEAVRGSVGGTRTAAWFRSPSEDRFVVEAGTGIFDLWPRDVLAVTGPDASSFLHSVVTQDIDSMKEGTWRWSFLLHPNGKVDSFFRVIKLPADSELELEGPLYEPLGVSRSGSQRSDISPIFILDTDPGYGPALVDSLSRYLIRVNASIRLVENYGFLRLAGRSYDEESGNRRPGSDVEETLKAMNVPNPPKRGKVVSCEIYSKKADSYTTSLDRYGMVTADGECIEAPRNRPRRAFVLEAPYPREGVPPWSDNEKTKAFDLLVEAKDAVGIWRTVNALGPSSCGYRALEEFRIAAGFPALGSELDSKTIVQETGLESVAVSFEKGCYLGQELVARIDSRGHVNRYLRRLYIPYEVLEEVLGPEAWEGRVRYKEKLVVSASEPVPTDGGDSEQEGDASSKRASEGGWQRPERLRRKAPHEWEIGFSDDALAERHVRIKQPRGSPIVSGGKEVGKVTSAALVSQFYMKSARVREGLIGRYVEKRYARDKNASGVFMLGYVRREIEPGSKVEILWDWARVPATVEAIEPPIKGA